MPGNQQDIDEGTRRLIDALTEAQRRNQQGSQMPQQQDQGQTQSIDQDVDPIMQWLKEHETRRKGKRGHLPKRGPQNDWQKYVVYSPGNILGAHPGPGVIPSAYLGELQPNAKGEAAMGVDLNLMSEDERWKFFTSRLTPKQQQDLIDKWTREK
jgi:hypothetical protein